MNAAAFLATVTLSLAAAVSAQAQTPAPAPAAPVDFATHKANIVAHIDQRLAAMTAARDCVNAANTQADLKACRKQHRGMQGKHAPA